MTESLARPSSASEHPRPGHNEVHLWSGHRSLFTQSDVFLRGVLSRYRAVAPADWVLQKGTHGKPAIAQPILEEPLDFNLSHSGDWLVCAVTGGTPVGVDIESVNEERDVMRIARRYFQAREVADLAQRDDDLTARFYDYWTLKEAALKVEGGPLAPALSRLGFALSGSRIDLQPMDQGRMRQAALLEFAPGYHLAVCCECTTRQPLAIGHWQYQDASDALPQPLGVRASG